MKYLYMSIYIEMNIINVFINIYCFTYLFISFFGGIITSIKFNIS